MGWKVSPKHHGDNNHHVGLLTKTTGIPPRIYVRVNQVHPCGKGQITSAMPSELTAFELSKLDLLDKKSRSLPPCFQDVTVAPNKLMISLMLTFPRSCWRQLYTRRLTRSPRSVPTNVRTVVA